MDNFANLKYLQIKRKTLADEGRHIHAAERKLPRLRDIKLEDRTERRKAMAAHRFDLQLHRKLIVRPAARAANLAYAFLKGVAYERVEFYTHQPLSTTQIGAIAANVQRFGPYATKSEADRAVTAWIIEGLKRQRVAA